MTFSKNKRLQIPHAKHTHDVETAAVQHSYGLRFNRTLQTFLFLSKVAYGINTGFGLFANIVIPPAELTLLQVI